MKFSHFSRSLSDFYSFFTFRSLIVNLCLATDPPCLGQAKQRGVGQAKQRGVGRAGDVAGVAGGGGGGGGPRSVGLWAWRRHAVSDLSGGRPWQQDDDALSGGHKCGGGHR